jgi:FAD/FMN-containing dehydrogenase
LSGKLLLPSDPAYTHAIAIRNLRYATTRPAGVAMVANAKDVATALAWAKDQAVEMTTRSGGHSFAGYSTSPGLVIDLNGMTKVTTSRDRSTMTCYGAATNEDVAETGRPAGVCLAGGQCPTVGIPGFTLGGGLGFYMRQHGLAIDALIETEMVTADGKVLKANAHEHPDLFWALRGGGGGNFGINTSFTFKPFEVPKEVTVFSFTYEEDACVPAFLAFQETLRLAPNTLGAVAHFSAESKPDGSARPILRIFGQNVDTPDATERLLAQTRDSAKARKSHMGPMGFWAAKIWLAGDVGVPNAFAERSRYYPKPLTEEAVAKVVDSLSKAPIKGGHLLSVESAFFAWSGQVAKVGPTDTAFVHRNDLWLQSYDVSWSLHSTQDAINELITWQDTFYRAMAPYGSDRAYQNFADPALDDPLEAYYAQNLPRLRSAKRTYDPHGVFQFAQGIRG